MKRINHYLIWFLILLVFCFVFSILIKGFDRIFVLISPPKVVNVSPEPESKDVSLNSSLAVNFDKPVKRREIQSLISPEVHGEWKFEEPVIKRHLFKTLVFEPAIEFEPETQYQVKLENIKGFGLAKSSSFQFTFQTQPKPLSSDVSTEASAKGKAPSGAKEEEPEPKITMLKIPLDWQDHPLSCEAASLKMALAEKKISVSETEIMEKIGYDLSSRKGDFWGDPYQKYVGDIDGKMCKTGYGVYWEPVAKAAQNWREAEDFSGWGIRGLTREIEAGNPVIFWGVLPTGSLTDCSWSTPQGKYILAFKETHVRLVIGFIGPSDSPSKIIINDPLAGRLYWSTSYFLENWQAFNHSGVVIR